MRSSKAEAGPPDDWREAVRGLAARGLEEAGAALALLADRWGALEVRLVAEPEDRVLATGAAPPGRRPASPVADADPSEGTLSLQRAGRRVGRLDVIGARPPSDPSADAEVQVLLDLLGSGLDIERLRREAGGDAADLRLLREAAERLTSVLEIDSVLERLAELLRRAVDHQLFSVLLWNEEEEVLESVFSRTWDGGCGRRWRAAFGDGVCGLVARERRPINVPDVAVDERYLSCGDDRTRSELAVPLLVQDRLIGVLDLEAHRRNAFARRDEDLLGTLASSIAIALDNSRLHAEVQRRERRMARDLESARRVHEALLPRRTPWVPGLQVAVAYRSARELGGDLYDILPWGEARTAFGVGDVAGKGAASALYGALALGALRAHAGGGECQPEVVMEHLDTELRQLRAGRRFLAFAFADFDCPTRRIRIANAGLPAPLLVRNGSVEELDLPGLPLGTLPGPPRRQIERRLEVGDVLLLVSDGIEEARDAEGRSFGPEEMHRTILAASASGSAREIAEALVDAADAWAEKITDDRTVLVARVTSACGTGNPSDSTTRNDDQHGQSPSS